MWLLPTCFFLSVVVFFTLIQYIRFTKQAGRQAKGEKEIERQEVGRHAGKEAGRKTRKVTDSQYDCMKAHREVVS